MDMAAAHMILLEATTAIVKMALIGLLIWLANPPKRVLSVFLILALLLHPTWAHLLLQRFILVTWHVVARNTNLNVSDLNAVECENQLPASPQGLHLQKLCAACSRLLIEPIGLPCGHAYREDCAQEVFTQHNGICPVDLSCAAPDTVGLRSRIFYSQVIAYTTILTLVSQILQAYMWTPRPGFSPTNDTLMQVLVLQWMYITVLEGALFTWMAYGYYRFGRRWWRTLPSYPAVQMVHMLVQCCLMCLSGVILWNVWNDGIVKYTAPYSYYGPIDGHNQFLRQG